MRYLKFWYQSRRLNSPDPLKRAAAAAALGEIQDARVVRLLIDLLREEHEQVKNAAALALTRQGGPATIPLLRLVRGSDESLRLMAAEILVKIGGEAVEPMLAALHDKEMSVRRLIIEKLADIGDLRAVEPLGKCLTDWHPAVRKSAIHALARLWGPVVDPLIDMLKDWNHEVRTAAATVLGESHSIRAVKPLVLALQDKEDDVREAAVGALAKIGKTSIATAMIDLLQDPRIHVQSAAIEVLLRLGPRSLDPLRAVQASCNPMTRITVLSILTEIARRNPDRVEKGVIEQLQKTLTDLDAAVRHSAAENLQKLNWKPKNSRQQATFLVAAQQWEMLESLGADAVEPLIAVLDSLQRQVRLNAVKILGVIADRRATLPLIRRLSDDFEDVVRQAVEALGRIGDPRGFKPLIILLRSGDYQFRGIVTEALACIGTTSPDLITRASEDIDPFTRQIATELLSRNRKMAVSPPTTRP